MPFSSLAAAEIAALIWNLAWTICRRCTDCVPNVKTPGYREVWFYAVNMLQNAEKMLFSSLAAAKIAALTWNLAWTICRRCSDYAPNFKTPGYRKVWFYAVNMLQNAEKMPFSSLAAAKIAALTWNLAGKISRRCPDCVINFETPGYRETGLYLVIML